MFGLEFMGTLERLGVWLVSVLGWLWCFGVIWGFDFGVFWGDMGVLRCLRVIWGDMGVLRCSGVLWCALGFVGVLWVLWVF